MMKCKLFEQTTGGLLSFINIMIHWAVVISFVAFFLSDVTFSGLGSDKQGPYDILMKYVEDCADPATAMVKTYPKIKKATRSTILVEGTTVLNVSFNNNIKILMNFGQSTPQGWKDNFLTTDFKGKGICDVMAGYLKPEDNQKIIEGLVNEKKNFSSCPIDPGVYTVNEINIRVTEFKGIPIFFYGKYRSKITLYMNDYSGPEIGCLLFYVDFVPKRSRKG